MNISAPYEHENGSGAGETGSTSDLVKTAPHPFTASLGTDPFRGDFERLRGRPVPDTLGTCQREVRKGVRCNTRKVAMPDSDYIGYCPKCFPVTAERDFPYDIHEDGSMSLKEEVREKYEL